MPVSEYKFTLALPIDKKWELSDQLIDWAYSVEVRDSPGDVYYIDVLISGDEAALAFKLKFGKYICSHLKIQSD